MQSPKAKELLSSRDEIMDMLLNLLKSQEVAALTFEMIEKRCQTDELTGAVTVRAMIQLFAMCRRVEMLIQSLKSITLSVAEVALIARAVPSRTCCDILCVKIGVGK